MQINFNIVTDGKYYARLVGLNRTLGKFGEQYKFTWSLFRDAEEREHAGVLDQYVDVNRKLYAYFVALGWPKVSEQGVDLKMTANAVTLPEGIRDRLYQVEVTTFETKSGTEKQAVGLLDAESPNNAAQATAVRKTKGGKS